MVEQKINGKIVFISSVAYKGSDAPKVGMMTHYNAAKGAIVSMTKGIAKELRQYGISVNCIAQVVCSPPERLPIILRQWLSMVKN